MKRILKFIFPIFLFFILTKGAFAMPMSEASQAEKTEKEIYLFYGDGCPHCKKEEKFLDKILPKYPEIKVNSYEIWENKENNELYKKVIKNLGITQSGIPTLIIGDKPFVGYLGDDTTGVSIEKAIKNYVESDTCVDIIYPIINDNEGEHVKEGTCEHGCTEDEEECPHDCGCSNDHYTDDNSEKIKIPFLGVKSVSDFSLPALTIVIGVLDGFNPCAMWVLIFLISLLFGMEDRKKMWIFGSTFIFVSGMVYFLFLSAWLNLFLFIGFISIIRYLIGIVALGSGIYHVKEYFTNKEGACKVVKGDDKKKLMNKFKKVVAEQNFWLALGGIIVLAAAVNLIELVCSAGLPAVYTQVLTMSNLSPLQYYGYLMLYILFFMLDDLFVFFIAMTTLKMTFINGKYTRYSNIIGGVLMLIIGLLLIFKHEWLLFG